MKDALVKLMTGLFAKFIRHSLTAAGGTVAASSGIDGGAALNVEQLAAGASVVLVSFVWSMWEDAIKKKQAAVLAAKPKEPNEK